MTRTAGGGAVAAGSVIAIALTAAALSGRGAPQLRFHHLHVRIADPGSALDEAAARSRGTKMLLKGHGAGVRVGAEYVILDREDADLPAGDSRTYLPSLQASAAFLEAREWLQQHAATVTPSALRDTAIAGAIPEARVDTVAFAADDVAAVVAALGGSGQVAFSPAEDLARVRLPSGLTVEIVGDTDAPDAFWCPMHPGVRSPRATKCPLCGMALVAMPPPRIGHYVLEVEPRLRSDRTSVSGLRLRVRDPESNGVTRSFLDVHERPLHLFIVSRDLERFRHVHPRQRDDGTFEIDDPLEPGAYVLIAEFLPAGGTPQTLHHALVTPGYTGPLFAPPPSLGRAVSEQTAGGLRIRLQAPSLRPLERSELRFVVSDERTGEPVTDLEPYLGAAGHLLVVSPDLTTALHGHPEGELSRGPAVTFDPVLPGEGSYKLWVQFQRRGQVITAPFVIEVR